uniref:Uncharacterized protein n=1 Tax=Cuerna arida TaxID=1464854 RepID=A0A1B6G644_9HEMI
MSNVEEKQFEESSTADVGVEDVIPESQLYVSDTERPTVEPETAATGEVEESQIQNVADTEPVLPLSELQSSCDTYMSQQNHMRIQRIDKCLIITSRLDSEEVNDLEEDGHEEVVAEMDKPAETDKAVETDKSAEMDKSAETDKSVEIDKSAETSAINSSLEVEPNDSLHNISLPAAQLPEEQSTNSTLAQDLSQDVLQESMELDNNTPKKLPLRKRKERSDDSSPSPKKFKQEDAPVLETSEDKNTSEEKSSFEVIYEGSGTKQEEGQVVNISSTPEKTIIINDSQEFSLRIDETSPPQVSEEKMKDSQGESFSWKSHDNEKMSSPSQSYLSQKSASSWTSHKDIEDRYQTRDKLIEDLRKENEHLRKKLAQFGGSISPEAKTSNAVGEVKTRTVTDERLTSSLIQWTIDDKTNKVLAAELKQISVVEELQGDKPGRYSITSSVSTKTSSSGGSVGLPGPFPLPGYTHRTRLSVMSSVSTSTSGSNNTKPGWDGPFLKPLLPAGKTAVTITCSCCGFLYPPVDKVSSPIMNGSPKLSEEEEAEVKSLSPKRSKKVSMAGVNIKRRCIQWSTGGGDQFQLPNRVTATASGRQHPHP